jgi:trans-2,3-dihydro-3-hydroxyanthranilate isomerase
MQLTLVDVFAERRFAGNQLAVVQDAGALDDETMQEIAREMNFSETTFVTAEAEASAKVRIFTPAEEMPFAGHPTLGTAWVLGRERGRYRLELAGGDVDVVFDGDLAWMTPPAPEIRELIDPERAARLVGLGGDELDPGVPPRIVHSGADYCLIAVRSLDALRRLRVDRDLLTEFSSGASVFAVCPGGYSDDADFAARMHFFDGVGLREDPATGSANSGFAAYLEALGRTGELVVEQGFEVGRPSRIYLRIDETLQVGGKVRPVAEGSLSME